MTALAPRLAPTLLFSDLLEIETALPEITTALPEIEIVSFKEENNYRPNEGQIVKVWPFICLDRIIKIGY